MVLLWRSRSCSTEVMESPCRTMQPCSCCKLLVAELPASPPSILIVKVTCALALAQRVDAPCRESESEPSLLFFASPVTEPNKTVRSGALVMDATRASLRAVYEWDLLVLQAEMSGVRVELFKHQSSGNCVGQTCRRSFGADSTPECVFKLLVRAGSGRLHVALWSSSNLLPVRSRF
ncbi:hypothetical protein PPTG_22814 [Phytophthora nicotianae INRA-310]|uniref:Uncharacterized protein n=1 Tax=Phytophthora nicotianae (strain INRA-310) TaxID=761204 RepID=W2QAR6_PHYN3|nr:hypothetical protein PPTG_22814 [Phytophthora nicotianae INRA-310]ETN09644.1 hypothetical protein PPTG_22814 [Phytophthora nicotianae INRA-310]